MRAKVSTRERQRQIVEAARKIIATRGMGSLTIRQIAGEVGISNANVYSHFATKNDVLLLLIDDIEKTLLDAVERAVSEKQQPLEMLENALKSHLSYTEQRRGVSLIVIAETLHLADKELRKRMFEVVNRYVARIRDLVAEGVQSGQVRQDVDLDTAALLFFALVHATATLWALSGFRFPLARRHKLLWESYRASIANGNGRPCLGIATEGARTSGREARTDRYAIGRPRKGVMAGAENSDEREVCVAAERGPRSRS